MNSIKFNNISFAYKKGKAVFQDFNLEFKKEEGVGKVTAIMGSSGSGKSTLMKLLLGIEKPISGSISMSPQNPVFSYVPQEPVLFEHLSIQDNAKYFQFAGMFKSRFNEELYNELVTSLGLEEVVNAKKTVWELSGGQKQRLSLLRALSIRPDFLLLDEPCTGLDAEVKFSFLTKLREITLRYGLYVLYITHHKSEAQIVSDEVAYLVKEKNSTTVKKAVLGSIKEFVEKPPVLEAAYIFCFPNIKILPVKIDSSNKISIARNEEETTEFWLVDDSQIQIGDPSGFPFKVINQSPIYTIIRNEEANIEWILKKNIFPILDDNIYITFSNVVIKYTNNS